MTDTDRTVHAEDDDRMIVRYEQAGKWYVESKRRYIPCHQLKLASAVRLARESAGRPGGTVHLGLPGGGRFDAAYRKTAVGGES